MATVWEREINAFLEEGEENWAGACKSANFGRRVLKLMEKTWQSGLTPFYL
jgi:hypothetical protein